MRLRLFDRIRWLVHPRRSQADSARASGAQGRHRRGRRAARDGTCSAKLS